MVNIVKAAWWDELADHYSFSNSGSGTIDSNDLFEDLYDHVDGSLTLMLTSSFQSRFNEVLEPSSQPERSTELIPLQSTGLIIDDGGRDFLAGDDGDNIYYGGEEGDYFSLGAGIDLVIGDDGASSFNQVDIAGYFHATSGIVVDSEYTNPNAGPTSQPPSSGGGLNPNQDVYTPTYEDWLARNILTVSNFEVGEGGDFIDLSVALASIGYTGNDPVADGYVKFGNLSSGMKIQFDADGPGGSGAKEMVRILDLSVEEFSIEHNLSWDGSVTGQGGSGGSGGGSEDSLFRFVPDDGNGDYDILYSIEGIFGSDHNDVINGHTLNDDVIYGSLGNDQIFGHGGNDILIGGAGNDTIGGGDGNDLIIVDYGSDTITGGDDSDTFKFTGSFAAYVASQAATILDFEIGSGGDIIDVTEILEAIGYDGSNAILDGYIQIQDAGDDTYVLIDFDGFGGQSAETLAVLDNVDHNAFTSNNLITEAPTTLLVQILGQSNAAGLRVFDGDSDSGITRMEDMLEGQTDYDSIVTPFTDNEGYHVMPAIGGTRVDGNSDFDADDVWWFPDEGAPGEILLRAVEILGVQIAELRASGDAVKPVFVWGAG